MSDMERRAFAADILKIETRAEGKRTLVGHAAVFNQLSEDLGGFREQIAPGAFADAIGKDDVRALFNHDPNFVLGRNMSKTLTLSEDQRGLAIHIDLPDTPTIRDLVVAPIERGDVSQMSFGFSVRPGGQDWAKDDNGQVVRTLKKLRLFDVSPVTFPAYPQTDVATRAMREWQDGVDEMPEWVNFGGWKTHRNHVRNIQKFIADLYARGADPNAVEIKADPRGGDSKAVEVLRSMVPSIIANVRAAVVDQRALMRMRQSQAEI